MCQIWLARRYLQELADKDLLVRVQWGAEKIRTGSLLNNERSNIEKQSLQIAEKTRNQPFCRPFNWRGWNHFYRSQGQPWIFARELQLIIFVL